MAQLQVLEQRIELATVKRTPRAVKVLARLGLLSTVVVVQKLIYNVRIFNHEIQFVIKWNAVYFDRSRLRTSICVVIVVG